MLAPIIPRRLLTAALVVCLACALGAQAPQPAPAIPDTPAGRQLSAWLEMFNDGDMARLEEFVRTQYPTAPPMPPGAAAQMRQMSGGFELIRVEETTDTHIVAVIKERNWDVMARATLDAAAEPPNLITAFSVLATPDLAAESTPRLSEEEALAAIEEKLDALSAGGLFSGAVMIARDGEPVFEHASGLADRESETPTTLDTKFRIGSMNKMVTAVSILQLVEAGEIDLSSPIGAYLTDYPNADLAERVTVEHLLTHTGGTGDIFVPEYFERRLETREHADYVALLGARDVAFEPGERFAYSNYGFVLLGAIVEAVTGGSYYDYVAEHVYAPAGMSASNSLPEDLDVPNRSVGYTSRPAAPGAPMPDAPSPNTDTLPYRGTAAGGGYSTVGDLIRFAEGLQSGTLLSPALVEQATTIQVETPPQGGYGYGFLVSEMNGARSFGHGGGAPGMNAELRVFPESGYVVAIAANLDPPIASRLLQLIGARLPLE